MSSGIAAIILWYPVDEDISLWEHLLVANPMEKLPNLRHEILEDLDGKKLYLFLCQMIKRNIDSDHVICQKDINYIYIVVNYEEKYTWSRNPVLIKTWESIVFRKRFIRSWYSIPFAGHEGSRDWISYTMSGKFEKKCRTQRRKSNQWNKGKYILHWNRKESIPKKEFCCKWAQSRFLNSQLLKRWHSSRSSHNPTTAQSRSSQILLSISSLLFWRREKFIHIILLTTIWLQIPRIGL